MIAAWALVLEELHRLTRKERINNAWWFSEPAIESVYMVVLRARTNSDTETSGITFDALFE